MGTIELSNGSVSFVGTDAVAIFRLKTLVSALKARKIGLRLSRGVSALKLAKAETGLRTNDVDQQIAAVERKIAEALKSVPVVQK